jgi:outer membrane lipoprotein carrier protein
MTMRSLLAVLLALAACLPTPAGADTVATLRGFLAETRTLDGEFTQTVIGARSRQVQQSSGKLAIARPGRFRWEVVAPFEQLLVADGEQVWLYDPDLAQVTVRRLGDALGGTPAGLLAGDGTVEAAFSLRAAGERDGLQWAEATPKEADGGFARLRFGFAGSELRTMELQDHFGQLTVIAFRKLRRNPRLPAGLFRFQPPAGVDVVGQ